MDTAVPVTATQLAIIWPLLGFLLIWMILFAVLAFCPDRAKRKAPAAISLPPANAHTPSPAEMLHVLVAQPTSGNTMLPVSSPSVASTVGSDFSNGAGTSTSIH